MTSILGGARKAVNAALRSSGFELVRHGERDHIKSFQPFKEMLAGAQASGLPLADYMDARFQVPGATQATIENMASRGVFQGHVGRICEIGPGTGRYLERVQKLCNPLSYEIYETDREWSNWLRKTYHVTAHDADGISLGDTASGSIDLSHAHKVFVYTPAVVTCRYFREMARVLRSGGCMVFDCVTEPCMDEETLEKWIEAKTYFPVMMPREFILQFFLKRQCSYRDSFFAIMKPGKSEYLIFRKN